MTKEQAIERLKTKTGILTLTVGGEKTIETAIKALEEEPSVTPKQRTGHWQDLTGLFFCSECDGGFAKAWNYCPNCGAKMESEEQA